MQAWPTHSRFEDLPVPICADLLGLWDRPPQSESPGGRAWLLLARANLALRGRDREAAAPLLRRARAAAEGEAWAEAEARMAQALLATVLDDQRVPEELEGLGSLIAAAPEAQRENLRARYLGQRSYVANRRGEHALALELVSSQPDSPALPCFARSRRANGLAYALFRLGRRAEAVEQARLAVRWAGDGGHVRLRAMALLMVARLSPEAGEAQEARARAQEIAAGLEDAVLSWRSRARVELRGAG